MEINVPRSEPFPSFWGESVLTMRYIAISPRGEITRWPDQRWRRLWMRLRGWQFTADSLIENQRRLNYIRSQPEWTAEVRYMSRDEITDLYGPGATP